MMQKRSRDAGGAHDYDGDVDSSVFDSLSTPSRLPLDSLSTPSRHRHGTSGISGEAPREKRHLDVVLSSSLYGTEGDGGHLRPHAYVREERR